MRRQTEIAPTDEPRMAEKRRTVCYCDRRQHALRVLGLRPPKFRAVLRDKVEAVAGSPALLSSFGERRDLCAECVDAHVNLGRQRRVEDADALPVRRRVGV